MDIFSDNIFEEHELKNNDIKDFCCKFTNSR